MNHSQDSTSTTRRRLLCGAAGFSISMLLAACSTAEKPVAANGALAKVKDIEVGGGIISGDLIVVRPDAETVKAYSRVCPHRQSSVDAPMDGIITCPAHHSTFAVADGGYLGGPADGTGLTEVAVTVKKGEVFRAK